jgi:cytochrome b
MQPTTHSSASTSPSRQSPLQPPQRYAVRVWDLPTRLFHWVLTLSVIGLVVTAKLGGNAMQWHLRLGYVVLALLLFRLVWGVLGGRWSRFTAFFYAPGHVLRYLRGQGDDGRHAHDGVGHSPLGALSVFALLAVLVAQVATGLLSDDEIAFAGPLTSFVSNAMVGQATGYHKDIGQYLVLGLIALHVLAIAFYVLVRRQRLVAPMLHGDKLLEVPAEPSRDDGRSRLLAVVVALASSALAWWVSGLGAVAGF